MSAIRQLLVVVTLLGFGGGCQFIRAGSMEKVQAVSDRPTVGNVYLVRGLIGIFSFGMDELAEKLEAQNIRCNVYQDAQSKQLASELKRKYAAAKQREPIVLIGHSLGADDVISIAHTLDEANIPVDLLVTIDAVNPRVVPKNVRTALNYYKPHALDGIPALRGIPVEPAVPGKMAVYNMSLTENRKDLMVQGTNHFNIDKNPRVHEDVIKQVLQVCRPRSEWVRGQSPQQPTALVAPLATEGTASARAARVSAGRGTAVPAAAITAPSQASASGVGARDASARRN
jgi:hypothetical protein